MKEYLDGDVNKESLERESAGDLVLPGVYQVAVSMVTFSDDEEKMIVDFEIITGTRPSEVGKTLREFIATNQKKGNKQKRLRLAIACGQVTMQQIEKAEKNNWPLEIDYTACSTHHCVIEIAQDEIMAPDKDRPGSFIPTGQMRSKIHYSNIWHIDSDTAKKKGFEIDRSKVDLDPFGNPPEGGSPAQSDFD